MTTERRRAPRRHVAAVVIGTALALVGAACSSSPDEAPPTTSPEIETTAPPRVDDGVLRIGVLLPASGEGASIGASELAAVRAAVKQSDGVGGVNGTKVELIVRDEGADAVAAGVALQQLLEANVDAIVGPASSNTAIALAPSIVAADVAACSPSASTMALDGFPDSGLLFRTIASDSLQAEAMAELVEQTGETSAAIVYVDDAYGRPFEEALDRALTRRGISIDDVVGFAIDDSEFDTEAARVVKSGAGAIALIGDRDAGSRVLTALAGALSDEPRDVIVNDALREPFSIGQLNAIGDDVRERIVGVSVDVRTTSAALRAALSAEDPSASGLFASQAYDCVTLFMIAAQQTMSTLPDQLKAVIPEISTAGSTCANFVDCRALLEQGRNINYDGPSGRLGLGDTGDPSAAQFDVFGFDDTGRDTSLREIQAAYR